MNKVELVAAMAEKAELSKKDAEAALKAFLDTVSEEMQKGEKVSLVGFGTFETVRVGKRTGTIQMGPRKGEKYTTPAHNAPKFKAGKALKELVNTKPKKTKKK